MRLKKKTDITDQVEFNTNDDECLPLTKCACGKAFDSWSFILSIYWDTPKECPNCHRKLCFGVTIRVYEVEIE